MGTLFHYFLQIPNCWCVFSVPCVPNSLIILTATWVSTWIMHRLWDSSVTQSVTHLHSQEKESKLSQTNSWKGGVSWIQGQMHCKRVLQTAKCCKHRKDAQTRTHEMNATATRRKRKMLQSQKLSFVCSLRTVRLLFRHLYNSSVVCLQQVDTSPMSSTIQQVEKCFHQGTWDTG